VKQRLLNISKILLIALFVSYYGSTTLFFHIHKTPYGIICHSHPFKGAHSHSQAQFETIYLLSIIVFTVHPAFLLSFIKLLYHIFHSRKSLSHVHLRNQTANPLRAPPFIV